MDYSMMRDGKGAVSREGAFAHMPRDERTVATGRTRVLVVDDNPEVLSVISKILSRFGYDVVSGKNGKEGLERYREKPCDVVLTDLEMPAMDGVTLARHIKSEHPLARVVLMTGNVMAEREVSQNSGKCFIDEILYKPIRFKDLHKTLLRWLG